MIIRTLLALFITYVFCALFSPSMIFAHGTGASLEKTVGNYVVDVGYDPEKPEAGTPLRLDFALLAASSSADVLFSNLWLRIEHGKETIFAGGIHRSEFGKTGLLFTFPTSGDYVISMRFEGHDETIAETSFPFSVAEGSREGNSWFLRIMFYGTGGFLVGLALGLLLARQKTS